MVTILNYSHDDLAAWREGRLSIDDLSPATQTVIAQVRQMIGLPEDWQPAKAIKPKPVEVEPELEPTTDIRESIARQIKD